MIVAKGAAKATNLWRSRSARDKPWLAEGLLNAAEAAAVAAEICDHTQQQQLSQTCSEPAAIQCRKGRCKSNESLAFAICERQTMAR